MLQIAAISVTNWKMSKGHKVYGSLLEDLKFVEGAIGYGEHLWRLPIQDINRISSEHLLEKGKNVVAVERSNLSERRKTYFADIEKSILKDLHARFRRLFLGDENNTHYIQWAENEANRPKGGVRVEL